MTNPRIKKQPSANTSHGGGQFTIARNHVTDNEQSPTHTPTKRGQQGFGDGTFTKTYESDHRSGKLSRPTLPGKIEAAQNSTLGRGNNSDTLLTEGRGARPAFEAKPVAMPDWEENDRRSDEYAAEQQDDDQGEQEDDPVIELPSGQPNSDNEMIEMPSDRTDNLSVPQSNTSGISRAQSSYVDESSAEYVPKTEEEVANEIEFMIGGILRKQQTLLQLAKKKGLQLIEQRLNEELAKFIGASAALIQEKMVCVYHPEYLVQKQLILD